LGANRELKCPTGREFSVQLVKPDDPELPLLSPILPYSHVYYLAPHAGCGCGWDYLGIGSEWDNLHLKSLRLLEAYLRETIHGGELAILSTCTETLGRRADTVQRVSIDEFLAHLRTWKVAFGSDRAAIAELVT
jgi:hypothetical protein